jgi:hypothetical protein
MVDGMEVSTHGTLHTVRLTMRTGGDGNEGEHDGEQL